MDLVVHVLVRDVCVVVRVLCLDYEVVLIACGPCMVIEVGVDSADGYVDDHVLDLAVADSLLNAVDAIDMIDSVHDSEIDVEVVVALIDAVALGLTYVRLV